MGDSHNQFKQLGIELGRLDTRRGGGAKQLKGFYAEYFNATYGNLERIQQGIAAREIVIDDNGPWDSIIKYSNGAGGRQIQDKVGYQYSEYTKMISSGRYDGGILRINPDHPIFKDEKKLNELNNLAKSHGIKITKGSVTKEALEKYASLAVKEGEFRSCLGMKPAAPITGNLIAGTAEVSYAVNTVQKIAKSKIEEINKSIYDTTSNFISENAAQINAAGLSQAESAAAFAAAMSVGRNAIVVLKGEEDFNNAVKDIITDTTTAAVLGYATGVTSQILEVSISDASFFINGTIQLSKQLIAYVDGEINEEQLVESITEISVHLTAAYIGRVIGGSIGSMAGPLGIAAGQFIGEMVSTAVCTDIVSAIKFSKELEKENQVLISLYRNAEKEIRMSQARLENLIQKENEELKKVVGDGFDAIVNGIQTASYDDVENGFILIGKKFNLTEEEIKCDKITRSTMFLNTDEVLVIE